jgi:hypothetical protein
VGQDVIAIVDQLVANATQSPIQIPPGPGHYSNITGDDILFSLQNALTFKPAGIEPGWSGVSEVIALAATGNSSGLVTLSSAAVDGEVEANSALFSGLAVLCLDWPHESVTVADVKYWAQLTQNLAPHTRGRVQSWSILTRCIGWPAPEVNPPMLVDVVTETPILLVQSLHDPECSYTWAVGVQAQIPSSVLLTRDGDGHTSYFLGGATAKAIDAYLVNGTLPAPNTVLDS